MRIRLCDEDRDRFGCPEWMALDLQAISIADLEELSERFDFDPMDWPMPFIGEVAFEDAGNPDAKRRRPRWYSRAGMWMTLRQNGCDVSWEDVGQVRFALATTEPEPGKEPEGENPSATSAEPTTPSSAMSSPPSRRRKSTA